MNKLRGILLAVKSLDARRRKLLAGLVGAVILLAAAAIFALVQQFSDARDKKAAVAESSEAAAGFDKNTDHYTFSQLNKAIEFANQKKCSEADAVYDDAVTHKNGLPDKEIAAFKKRIEDICSGKPSPASKENLL